MLSCLGLKWNCNDNLFDIFFKDNFVSFYCSLLYPNSMLIRSDAKNEEIYTFLSRKDFGLRVRVQTR